MAACSPLWLCCCTTPPQISLSPSPFLPCSLRRRFIINPLTSTNTITPSCLQSPNSTSSLHDQTNAQHHHHHWIVLLKTPPPPHAAASASRQDLIDYYVQILRTVLGGSDKDAQASIYNASSSSSHTHFGFCCDLDQQASQQLARLPQVLSVKPDPDFTSLQKDYSQTSKHWVVHVQMPQSGLTTRVHLLDYYTQMLTRVFGNEKDAQMCIYHISLQPHYGFCCQLDDQCAKELAGVPGVISVRPDKNVDSDNKDYGAYNLENPSNFGDSSTNLPTDIKTKKLFVTGLSFYTSEKTLRAAFEVFGELVEVKIIMDKISKRSKGFAFIEYTTEEAAGAALREMNGKIINGWMIVVDVAKTNPQKYSRGRPRPAS